MANKTITELTAVSTPAREDELALYDVSNNSTGKATVNSILSMSGSLYADDEDEPTGEVDFTSQDTELSPTSSTSVDLLTGNDSWSQRFVKISQMFKNVRYLLGKLGTTSISSLGDGTVTGAINKVNNDFNLTTVFSAAGLSTTETSYDADWQNHRWLIIRVGRYSNITNTIVIPYEYFQGTTSSSRIQIDIGALYSNIVFEIYQNGTGKIKIKARSTPSADDRLAIYGIGSR